MRFNCRICFAILGWKDNVASCLVQPTIEMLALCFGTEGRLGRSYHLIVCFYFFITIIFFCITIKITKNNFFNLHDFSYFKAY